MPARSATERYRAARDQILALRGDHAKALAEFDWPRFDGPFNWAVDWFDSYARDNGATALHIVEQDGREARYSFADMVRRSDQVAGWLRAQGVASGDRVVLMLGNQVELWESMLAVMKLGAVIMPTTTALGPADLADRIERGGARHVVVTPRTRPSSTPSPVITPHRRRGRAGRVARLRRRRAGRRRPDRASGHAARRPPAALLHQRDDEPAEARRAHPCHLSRRTPVDVYWLGLQPGDVHLNISSPGWAKHAWSCFFAPWIAEATVFVYNYARFDAGRRCSSGSAASAHHLLRAADGVAHADPGRPVGRSGSLREVLAAGEPLNPEVIEQVQAAWGLTIRDGYGQTETAAAVAQLPRAAGQARLDGPAAARLPVVLVDPVTGRAGRRGRDLPRPVAAPAGADDRLPGRPRAQRRGDGRRLLPHRRRRARGTTTATSPTSAAPTTSSRRATTRSPRSSWRAC